MVQPISASSPMKPFDYAASRTAMIESQLRPNGVRDIPVLRAFALTPREVFLPAERRFLAYSDEPVLLSPAKGDRPARHLMQPMILAKLLQEAELRPDDKVLDVACATGYSAALLAHLTSNVIALEEEPELAAAARKHLKDLGHENVTVVEGPLTGGAPEHQPFDVIFINGGIEVEPESLYGQLKEGGRIYTVFGPEVDGEASVFTKVNDVVSRRGLFDASACILPGFEAKPAFVF